MIKKSIYAAPDTELHKIEPVGVINASETDSVGPDTMDTTTHTSDEWGSWS